MRFFNILLLIFITTSSALAQDFAPVGAEWYYHEEYAFSGNIDYIKFTVEKDTLFHGKICQKITKRHKVDCNDRPQTEFVYTSNDTTYFYDSKFNQFQILYIFNFQVNTT